MVIRIFHKNTKLAILITEALPCESKKYSNKMSPHWVLKLGPLPFRSDALLSELERHVLLEDIQICLFFLRHLHLGILIVRIYRGWPWKDLTEFPSNTCLTSSERRASDLNGEGPMFNTHWNKILLLEVLFSRSKASDAILWNPDLIKKSFNFQGLLRADVGLFGFL